MRIFRAPALAIPTLAWALAVGQNPAPAAPALLPPVIAYTLDKAKATLPADFTAPFNLLILSFARDQQEEVDTWLPVAGSVEHAAAKTGLWLLPVSSRANILYRWWMNSSLRNSLPAAQPRTFTVPLYVNKPAFLQALRIGSEAHIAVLLADRSGHVLWRTEGAATEAKRASLKEYLNTPHAAR